jgi:hypothetical protein
MTGWKAGPTQPSSQGGTGFFLLSASTVGQASSLSFWDAGLKIWKRQVLLACDGHWVRCRPLTDVRGSDFSLSVT